MNSITIIENLYNIKFGSESRLLSDNIESIFAGDLNNVNFNNSILVDIVGLYYEFVEKDYIKAEEYYLKSIDMNNDEAMNNLGALYYKTNQIDKMTIYYKRGAELKNIKCMINLGLYFESVKDYTNMLIWFGTAANFGSSFAMYKLGVYYQTIEDTTNMLKWLSLSVENGNPDAMYNLALYHENFKPHIMCDYLKMASDLNHVKSIRYLGLYELKNVYTKHCGMLRLISALEIGDYQSFLELRKIIPHNLELFKTLKKNFHD